MRNNLKITTLAAALAAALVCAAPPAEAGGSFGMHIGSSGFGVSVGIGDWGPYTNNWTNPQWSLDFNVALSGYGEWVLVGDLGRVWRPWVAVGWQPYTYGRWVRTTLGWTWVAYEPWGYVPHHYGSWAMCDFGWAWVPGYSYSTANVVWVRSGGYVGWYARPPRGWSHAARSYRHGYRDGYRDGWREARYATYVDWHHMGSDNVSHYAVRHALAAPGQVQTHAAPPTADEVRRRGGISVPEAQISQRTVAMNGRQVTIARPEGVARNIENHASGTAAEALSPRALERRQPAVRPVSSTAPYDSRSLSSPRAGSSDRQHPTVNGSRSPRQPESGRLTADADARSSGRLGSSGSLHGGQLRRSPERAGSVGSSRAARPVELTAPSGRRESSTSIEPRRKTISTQPARGTSLGSSTRTVIKPSPRTGPTANRLGARSAPPVGRTQERSSESATPPRPETGRTMRGARRQTDPKNEREAETTKKTPPRSPRIKKR